jgi:hypothetical protein
MRKRDEIIMKILVGVCVGMTPISFIFRDVISMLMGLYYFQVLLFVIIALHHKEIKGESLTFDKVKE